MEVGVKIAQPNQQLGVTLSKDTSDEVSEGRRIVAQPLRLHKRS